MSVSSCVHRTVAKYTFCGNQFVFTVFNLGVNITLRKKTAITLIDGNDIYQVSTYIGLLSYLETSRELRCGSYLVVVACAINRFSKSGSLVTEYISVACKCS